MWGRDRSQGRSGRALSLGMGREKREAPGQRLGGRAGARPSGWAEDAAPRKARASASGYLFFRRREAACGRSSDTNEAQRTHVSRETVAQSGAKPWREPRYARGDTEGPVTDGEVQAAASP